METSSDQELHYLIREPEKGYVDTRFWMPKALVNETAVKRGLEAILPGGEDRLILWKDAPHHIVAPREFLGGTAWNDLPFPVVDMRPGFPTYAFEDKVVLRDAAQERAWAAFSQVDRGILNLACGRGKTVLGLKKVAQRGHPALIVVNTGPLLDQWAEEAEAHLDLRDVGIVQGPTFDWQRPLVIGMIQTLSQHADEWPHEFLRHFGTIIFDEIHHLAAPIFSRTAPLFWGARFGLTATPERADGLELVYYSHVGRTFYSDMEHEVEPVIYFQRLNVYIDMGSREVRDRFGEFNSSRYRAYLGQLEDRNYQIARHIRRAMNQDRKILVLGHSISGLYMLQSSFPDAPVVTGKTAFTERLPAIRQSQVTFATMGVATEALNAPMLDTVFFTTPLKSWRQVVQGMGRALRRAPGKKRPVIVIFEDTTAGPSIGLCRAVKRDLVQHGYSPVTVEPENDETREAGNLAR